MVLIKPPVLFDSLSLCDYVNYIQAPADDILEFAPLKVAAY